MAKSTAFPVKVFGKRPVFADVSKLSSLKGIEEVAEVRPIRVDVDVLLPDAAANRPMVEVVLHKAFQNVVTHTNNLINNQLEQSLQIVLDKHREDQDDANANAYSEATAALDKANKYIKDLMDDFRVELRKAVAKALTADGEKVSAKELMTIGKSSFKEMAIILGAFKTEVSYEAVQDITKDLKTGKGKWMYCALLKTGTEGVLAVDRKKQVKKAEWSKLKKQLPGSVAVIEGVLKPTGNAIEFRFHDPKPDPVSNVLLRSAVTASAEGFKVSQCTCGKPLQAMPSAAELKKLDSAKPETEKGK